MKKKFITEIYASINKNDLIYVRNIYQPIIGIEAVSLYHLLIDYNMLTKYKKTFFFFESIEKTLNINHISLEQSRKKLEAVGLIRTFERSDNLHFIFKINKPLNPQAFRKNSLLFQKTIKKIGEIVFERIEFATKGENLNKDEYKEISIKYQDLFDLNYIDEKQNTLEIQLPKSNNKDDAVRGLTAAQFIKYLTNARISPSLLVMIQNLQKIGFSSSSLNLIIDYSFEINDKIVANHIKTIAYDLYDKKIIDFNSIKFELNLARDSKKHKKSQLDTNYNQNEVSKDYNWEELFESLGDF